MPDYLSLNEEVVLLETVGKATHGGQLVWQLNSSGREDDFVTSTEQHRFQLYSRDQDGVAPFVLEIQTKSEQPETIGLIENVSDSQTNSDVVVRRNKLLRGLYALVRRRVFNVDRVVQDLFADLEALTINNPTGGGDESDPPHN